MSNDRRVSQLKQKDFTLPLPFCFIQDLKGLNDTHLHSWGQSFLRVLNASVFRGTYPHTCTHAHTAIMFTSELGICLPWTITVTELLIFSLPLFIVFSPCGRQSGLLKTCHPISLLCSKAFTTWHLAQKNKLKFLTQSSFWFHFHLWLHLLHFPSYPLFQLFKPMFCFSNLLNLFLSHALGTYSSCITGYLWTASWLCLTSSISLLLTTLSKESSFILFLSWWFTLQHLTALNISVCWLSIYLTI